ncbi:Surface cell-adhesion protein [Mycena venus]|uniref:Surface cell-adhesion protein n=1 Tax=Mycena venus TaxID=2733690 RepID=A0A8H7CPI8_9AGAR|nr:Surface cell-adhesion protein [Mycena venus]
MSIPPFIKILRRDALYLIFLGSNVGTMFSLATALLCVSALLPHAARGIPAKNHPTLVNLRIEGAKHTIFESTVVTMGHNLTTASGGTHHCDGTNFGANKFPGPTCTSALNDAAAAHGFQWDATFFTEFDDYFITSIDHTTETDTKSWGLLLNFNLTQVGGCQQEVNGTDHILWAFDAFNAKHFLKLDGPTEVKKGVPATFVVTDGKTEDFVEGASVHGKTSGANGAVVITFGTKGVEGLKATLDGSIRSNRVDVKVY